MGGGPTLAEPRSARHEIVAGRLGPDEPDVMRLPRWESSLERAGTPCRQGGANAPGRVVAEARPPVRAHQEERTGFRPIRGSGRGNRCPNGEQAALGSRRNEA